VETGNYIIDKHNIKTRPITGKHWWKATVLIQFNSLFIYVVRSTAGGNYRVSTKYKINNTTDKTKNT
jgi:hypothetical protein